MLLRPGHLTLDELQAIHAGAQALIVDPLALPGILASAAVDGQQIVERERSGDDAHQRVTALLTIGRFRFCSCAQAIASS